MNGTITRSAGAVHGQEMETERMKDLIRSLGREARQRSTLYEQVLTKRQITSSAAAPLEPVH